MKRSTLIKGTFILAFAGFISRILGFVNRIYLSNVIGAEGIGLYQLVFPIYMIGYTVCCSGLFTAISRLTSEEYAKGGQGNPRKLLRVATLISFVLSFILCILLYYYAPFISCNIIHEPRIEGGLKIVSISIPFTAITHCIKGYFYGLNKPSLPAFSQITEQIVRIGFIYLLSSSFLSKGLTYACTIAVIGMALGELSSCILMLFGYLFHQQKKLMGRIKMAGYQYVSRITTIALPLTANRLITTVLSSYETILIPGQLEKHGYSHSFAISIYGTLTGMAFPLIYFPTVITTAASLMLLPAISEAHFKKQNRIISETVTKTIQLSILLGIIFTFFFLAFGNSLGTTLYNEPYVGQLLIILSFLCPFLYLQTTMGSLLNGMDMHMITFRNSMIGLTLRIVFIFLLIPHMGLEGYLIGLMISLVLVSVLDIHSLLKKTSIQFKAVRFILLPILCCITALILQKTYAAHLPFSSASFIGVMLQACLFLLILSPLLVLTKSISLNFFKH